MCRIFCSCYLGRKLIYKPYEEANLNINNIKNSVRSRAVLQSIPQKVHRIWRKQVWKGAGEGSCHSDTTEGAGDLVKDRLLLGGLQD